MGLLRNLPTLFDGTHIRHPLASRRGVTANRILAGCAGRRHDRRGSADAGLPQHRSAARRAGRPGMSLPQETSCTHGSSARDRGPAGVRPYLWMRTVFRWALAGGFFFSVCPVLILLGIFVDPRRNDAPQRWLCRNVVRLAGARVEVRRRAGFDPNRVCFLVSNHVNLFDPFVLYSVVPQFIRGLELESHFRIPVYGWLMKRFGNVPVPDGKPPIRPETHVAHDARGPGSGREPGRLSRGQAERSPGVSVHFTMAHFAWRRSLERRSRR